MFRKPTIHEELHQRVANIVTERAHQDAAALNGVTVEN